MFDSIKYDSGTLSILDQLQLPAHTVYSPILNIEDAYNAIRDMKVRGAPAISIVAALSLAVELYEHQFATKKELQDYVKVQLDHLSLARPTAVNLKRVCDFLIKISQDLFEAKDVIVGKMKERLIKVIESLKDADVRINKAIGKHGGEYILSHNVDKPPCTVLTHCNTGSLATAGYGTALGVVRWLNEQQVLEQAYCTETRPYNQGSRLTAYELVSDHIPSTLICDSAVAALMKCKKISAVIVGADRVAANGDTANKIGTYQIAVCASYHNVPFYVACPRSSFDFTLKNGNLIPIEERPADEMMKIASVPIAAPGIRCWNPGFDVTPAKLITGGIITECGVFSPDSLREHEVELTSPGFTKIEPMESG